MNTDDVIVSDARVFEDQVILFLSTGGSSLK